MEEGEGDDDYFSSVRLVSLVVWGIVGIAVLFSLWIVISLVMVNPPDPSPPEYELDVEYEAPVVDGTNGTVELAVVEPDGESVEDAHVIIQGDTLRVDDPYDVATGQNSNSVRVSIHPDPDRGDLTPEWRGDQESGKLSVELRPPADSQYVDNRENAKVLVVRNLTDERSPAPGSRG